MTDEATIINAAEEHFIALSDRPYTVWPNQKVEASTPRVEFSEGPVSNEPFALDGMARANFLFQVTVITEGGGRTKETRALTQSIIDHFKVGTDLAGAKVSKRPVKGAPYSDDSEWRQPITISVRGYLAP